MTFTRTLGSPRIVRIVFVFVFVVVSAPSFCSSRTLFFTYWHNGANNAIYIIAIILFFCIPGIYDYNY